MERSQLFSLLIAAALPASAWAQEAPGSAELTADELALCVETQYHLDGLIVEIETGRGRIEARRSDIDAAEARLIAIATTIEETSADLSGDELQELIVEFNSINANRQAMIPSYQEDADHVGDTIDEYNSLTDRYNADCGDVTYVVEDLQQLCATRPEFGETGWCTRVLASASDQD